MTTLDGAALGRQPVAQRIMYSSLSLLIVTAVSVLFWIGLFPLLSLPAWQIALVPAAFAGLFVGIVGYPSTTIGRAFALLIVIVVMFGGELRRFRDQMNRGIETAQRQQNESTVRDLLAQAAAGGPLGQHVELQWNDEQQRLNTTAVAEIWFQRALAYPAASIAAIVITVIGFVMAHRLIRGEALPSSEGRP